MSLSWCSQTAAHRHPWGLLQGSQCAARSTPARSSLVPQDPQPCPTLPAEGALHAHKSALHTQCPAPLPPYLLHRAHRLPQTTQHESCTRDPPVTNPLSHHRRLESLKNKASVPLPHRHPPHHTHCPPGPAASGVLWSGDSAKGEGGAHPSLCQPPGQVGEGGQHGQEGVSGRRDKGNHRQAPSGA